ncbi:glycosyl hydrolase family 26-domain-containing protein [Aspergillus spinulosporus]
MFVGRIPFVSLLLSPLVAGLSYDNIDKAATPQAKELLRYIQAQYGSKYISGQQDPGSLHKSHTVEDAISFHRQGGINALVWHWHAPTCLLDSEEQPWYRGFYTEATCFDVGNALSHGGNGTDYGLLIRDIDAIAVQLKRLADANIPVLFRPLHEPEGGWFWWGAHGPAPFKQLWDLIYDRITRVHDIHNLVWICNTADPSWYPGNNKCDIATIDNYGEAGDHGVIKDKFQALQNVTRGERVLALAEVGSIPDPELQAKENVSWAYWMTWNDEFIKDGKHNSPTFLQNVFNSKRIMSLDGAARLNLYK